MIDIYIVSKYLLYSLKLKKNDIRHSIVQRENVTVFLSNHRLLGIAPITIIWFTKKRKKSWT